MPAPRYGTRKQKKNPYFWWYEYLKRHEAYRACCDRNGLGDFSDLYEIFGNVHNSSFSMWWKGHKSLFRSEKPFVIHCLTSRENDDAADFETTLFLGVNLLASKRAIQKEFNRLLRKHHSGKRGRPAWDDTTSNYRLDARPNVRYLELTLKVYDLRRETNLPLWKIGNELRLNLPHAPRSKQDSDKRRVMTILVSRYFRQAKALIDNTGEGKFPVNR